VASARRILIVGGGIVGLATALNLRQRFAGAEITLLEKESEVGQHQSKHNSGVLHAGLYYKPGSLKAKLAVQGLREMIAFCQAHNVPHEICGKIVVAVNEQELPRLHTLRERGMQNGLQHLRVLSRDEMVALEPNVGGIAALHVPEEGIVDFSKVCLTLLKLLREKGCNVITSARVIRIQATGSEWTISTSQDEYRGDYLVNCAGLYCDRIGRLAGEKPSLRIVPFRGKYYRIRRDRQHLVRNLIYPVPDTTFPFLGVHFTRQIGGGVEAGPNAVLAVSREGYRYTDFNLADLQESLQFVGLRRFVWRHAKMCWEELKRSCSRKLFCDALRKLVPDIREDDLLEGGAGVRAQAMGADGELLQDFCFVQRDNALHVFNAPSPAATASLAIGSTIAAQVPD
jgi:L-2-hydroxyglutarate oxidase LhgO